MQKYSKKNRIVLALFIAISLLSMIFAQQAFALPANPDSIILSYTKVFQNIFVSGDMLFIGEYNINYAVEPSEAASDTFYLQLRSADNATLIRQRAVPDYQLNLSSIYLTPSEVTSAGITWGTSYYMRIVGNPAMFGTLTEGTNMSTKPLSGTDWEADGTLSSKSLLVDYCKLSAARIEDDIAIVLLSTVGSGKQVLNSAGRIIFLAAIPNLDSAVPELFALSTGTTAPSATTVNATYEDNTTISSKMGSQISDAFTGIGTWLGISQQMSGGIWIMLVMLTIMSIIFMNSGNSAGAMTLTIPIVVMGGYLGAIPMWLIFTVAMFMTVYMFYFFWLHGT